MPGFSAEQLEYNVLTSNQVVVMIGDIPVAFAQSVNPSRDFGTEQLFGIGSTKPQENVQLRSAPAISVDGFALTSRGIARLNGGQNLAVLLADSQFNIAVNDADGNLVELYVGCVAANYAKNIPANQPISESITFLCLDVLDANGASLLTSNNAYDVPNGQGVAVNGGLGIRVGGALSATATLTG